MMDETFVMNQVKEACCYVTVDLKSDLEACRWVIVISYSNNTQIQYRVNNSSNSIVQEYILPDFSSRQMGRIRRAGEEIGEHDQIMHMANERFVVPEVLFRPDDIGEKLDLVLSQRHPHHPGPQVSHSWAFLRRS
jgi:actin-related protein 6